jgi:hemolysin D
MNAIVKTQLPQVIAKPPRMMRADQEFLPAALEILETPPSPIKMSLILTICGFIVISLGWAYVGRVDIIAVAQGKMQPAGRVKVIQPLDNGKVSAIPVVNGQTVRAGDFLVELDSAEVRADEIGLANDYASLLAEIIRRRAVATAVQSNVLSPPPTIPWGANIPFSMREREDGVMAADLAKLAATIAGLSAQREQKKAELDRLTKTVAIQKELVGTLQERVDMRTTLVKASAGTKASVIDATEVLQNQRTNLASQEGQLAETTAGLDVLAREAETTLTTFASDNAQKLANTQRQADEAEQKLVKAQARTQHMTLVSPIAGTVQASNVTTIGQVVTTGQEIMRIVPTGPSLEIEAYLANKDVGFVKVGQEAIIKIDAFPFTRYGTLKATITRIAKDAIPEPEAQQTEGESTRGSTSNMFAGAQRVQNLVFPITLTPETTVMKADGGPVGLLPGMAATVEVKTGRRRILEYIFSPMVEIASNALKER